jgi:hypothetical protein
MTGVTSRPSVSGTALLTEREAALLSGKSKDTVRRRREDGRFPGAHQRVDDPTGTWVIPVEDLVRAGMLAADQVETAGAATVLLRTQNEMTDLRVGNAHLLAVVTGLEARLADKDSEIAHLRRIISKAVSG